MQARNGLSYRNMRFGPLLRELREAQGINQSELARRSNINHSYVSYLEREVRSPTETVIDALAKGLKASPALFNVMRYVAGFRMDDRREAMRESLQELDALLMFTDRKTVDDVEAVLSLLTELIQSRNSEAWRALGTVDVNLERKVYELSNL